MVHGGRGEKRVGLHSREVQKGSKENQLKPEKGKRVPLSLFPWKKGGKKNLEKIEKNLKKYLHIELTFVIMSLESGSNPWTVLTRS